MDTLTIFAANTAIFAAYNNASASASASAPEALFVILLTLTISVFVLFVIFCFVSLYMNSDYRGPTLVIFVLFAILLGTVVIAHHKSQKLQEELNMVKQEFSYSELYDCFCEISDKTLSHELSYAVNNRSEIDNDIYNLDLDIKTSMICLKSVKSTDQRRKFYKEFNISNEAINTIEKIHRELIGQAQNFVDNDDRTDIEDKDLQEFMFFIDDGKDEHVEINGQFEYDKSLNEYHFKCIDIYSTKPCKFLDGNRYPIVHMSNRSAINLTKPSDYEKPNVEPEYNKDIKRNDDSDMDEVIADIVEKVSPNKIIYK